MGRLIGRPLALTRINKVLFDAIGPESRPGGELFTSDKVVRKLDSLINSEDELDIEEFQAINNSISDELRSAAANQVKVAAPQDRGIASVIRAGLLWAQNVTQQPTSKPAKTPVVAKPAALPAPNSQPPVMPGFGQQTAQDRELDAVPSKTR